MGHQIIIELTKNELIGKVIRVQILDDAVRISHRANTLGKGMDPTILPTAIGK